MHAPQPMHESFANAGNLPSTKIIAFCLHEDAHFPHFVHFEKFHFGIAMLTFFSFFSFADKSKWSLGHSASQSTSIVLHFFADSTAKETATIDLPVPPFPPVTAIFKLSHLHLSARK